MGRSALTDDGNKHAFFIVPYLYSIANTVWRKAFPSITERFRRLESGETLIFEPSFMNQQFHDFGIHSFAQIGIRSLEKRISGCLWLSTL